QREGLAQNPNDILQLIQGSSCGTRDQADAGGRGENAIEVGPGNQLDQAGGTLQHRVEGSVLGGGQVAKQHPALGVGTQGLAAAVMEGELLLTEVGCNARVDIFDLAGLALEGGRQLATQQVDVFCLD